jgi:hypothetical protein
LALTEIPSIVPSYSPSLPALFASQEESYGTYSGFNPDATKIKGNPYLALDDGTAEATEEKDDHTGK